MSMSIPMVWPEVIWQPEWGTYQGIEIDGDAVVDGGLLSNFPIELFISRDKDVQDLMGTPKQDSAVLGLLIDETRSVSEEKVESIQLENKRPKVTDVLLVKRLLNLVDTVTQAHDKMVIDANENLVVRLPAAGYGTTEFDMSDQKRNILVDAGKRAMREFFSAQSQTAETIPEASFGIRGIPSTTTPKSTDRIATNLLKFKKP
jgi:predicted acylesterase/phospholipase RssA